ncbi:MAG: glycosyltransferase family 39 protein [Bacteroidota bacterium]
MATGVSDRSLFVLLLAVLLLRLAAIPLVHADGYTSDEREYMHLARRVAGGEEFVDSNGDFSIRAPLYPGMLALVLLLSDGSVVVGHIANALLGTGIVLLLYTLALDLLRERRGARIALAVGALYPGLIVYGTLLQTESLYICFFLVALLAGLRWSNRPSWESAVLLGLSAGCAALTRAVFVGFIPLLLLSVWWACRSRSILGGGQLLVALGLALLVLAPWLVRSYDLHGSLIPVSAGGGNSLLTGNNPFSTGGWRLETGFQEWYAEQARRRGVEDPDALDEVSRSRLSGDIAVSYILGHPLDATRLGLKKSHIYWIYPITHSDSNIGLQVLAVGFDALLYAGISFGILFSIISYRRFIPLYAALAYFWGVHAVLHAEARFRLPVVPILILFFSLGCVVLLEKGWRDELLGSPLRRRWIASLLLAVAGVYGLTAWLFIKGNIT